MQIEQNNHSRVFITGLGAVSSIGLNTTECKNSLQNCVSGIKKCSHFHSAYCENYLFGEVAVSDEELRKKFSNNLSYTRTTLLALKAFQEAIESAKLSSAEISSFRTGLISASTVGGMCYTDALFTDANKKDYPSVYINSYEGSDHTLRIIENYGIRGYTDTINTACSSSANAIMLGGRLLKSGRLDRVIVGGADSLAKFTVNGFSSLMILDSTMCKPFDEERNGLSLGEGAAYIVLESEKTMKGKVPLAELVGCGNANDAFHPSATSDNATGPVLAMQRALDDACVSAKDISYINAHGTGTQNNDLTESFAFSKLFENVPYYNSTKSYTGHTLAAAGALEFVFSILGMNSNEIYASLNCRNPIKTFPFSPVLSYLNNTKITYFLSNSFGFGGNCTSIIAKNVHH